MIFESLTSAIAGADTLQMSSFIFGGANVFTDGTNAATVIVREDNAAGKVLLHAITKTSMEIMNPIKSNSKTIYYSITGTGATAQLFGWVN